MIVTYALILSTLDYNKENNDTIKIFLLIADIVYALYIALWVISKLLKAEEKTTNMLTKLMKNNEILLIPLIILIRFKITNLINSVNNLEEVIFNIIIFNIFLEIELEYLKFNKFRKFMLRIISAIILMTILMISNRNSALNPSFIYYIILNSLFIIFLVSIIFFKKSIVKKIYCLG